MGFVVFPACTIYFMSAGKCLRAIDKFRNVPSQLNGIDVNKCLNELIENNNF